MKAPDKFFEGYVFDLDGTVYLGDELLPDLRRQPLGLDVEGQDLLCHAHRTSQSTRPSTVARSSAFQVGVPILLLRTTRACPCSSCYPLAASM